MKFVSGLVMMSSVLILAGCNSPPATSSGSMTVFLVERPDLAAQCEAIVADRSNETHAGSDGSTWRWMKANGEPGMLYCRSNPANNVSAWQEASRDEGATNSLKFTSENDPAVFQAFQK